jgi:hypothetical protein
MSRRVNPRKDQKNKLARGFSVLEIVEGGILLGTLKNSSYSDQFLKIYKFNNYAWVVVISENPPRYVTHYPSRKFKKKYAKEFK